VTGVQTFALPISSGGYASVDQIIQASGWQAITADQYRKMAERMKHMPRAIQSVDMRKRQPMKSELTR
jgi:hypothetical protein